MGSPQADAGSAQVREARPEGARCQLRSDMLRTYYHHRETERIRQYEYENFVMEYEAYTALGGNSFMEKIYGEVKKWEVVT